MGGMTLEQLFIKIAPQYLNKTDATRVKSDISDIDKRTQKLGNTLDKIGKAFLAFGVVGVRSFSSIEKSMSEFAGKAGVSLNQFEKMFAASSRRIARQTGVNRRIILQTLQEGTSLGLNKNDLNKVSALAAKLHAGNQADMVQSVTASAAANTYGLGTPEQALRTIYGASQVGSGQVADYGSVFKQIAPSASLAKLDLETMLGTMAFLGGMAPSLTEGGTWFNSFLKAMAAPKGTSDALLQQRTGQSFNDLNARLAQRGGLQEVLNLLRETFEDSELFEIFGRQEAVKFFSAVTSRDNAIDSMVAKVEANTASMPVQSFWDHFSDTLENSFARFTESFNNFTEDFGKPIARILKLMLNVLTPLLDGITFLNRATGGLIAGIATLVGALGLSVTAFRAARFLFGGAIFDAVGSAVGSAVGNALGGQPSKPDAKGSSTASKIGAFGGLAAAVGTFLAFWKQMGRNIKNFFVYARDSFRSAKDVADFFGRRSTQNPKLPEGGINRIWLMSMKYLDFMENKLPKILTAPLFKILSRLTVIGAIFGTFISLFRWFTRNTAAAEAGRNRALERRRLRRHFAAGGALDDTAPLPGEIDSLEIQLEQAEVLATARRKAFFDQFISGEINAIGSVWGFFAKWINKALDLFIPDLRLSIDAKLAEAWDGFTSWVHEMFTAPLDWLIRWNAERALERQRGAAGFWGWMLEKFGFNQPPGASRLEGLIEPAPEGVTPIPALTMSAEEAAALGLTGAGAPSNFLNSPAIDFRSTLPIPNIDALNRLNAIDAERMRQRAPITVNQTINVDGAGDPEAVAKKVMSTGSTLMQNAIYEILENTESPVLR